MSQGGFFERQPLNTRTLAVVLLLHGAALTALALSRAEVIREHFPNTTITFIPNPPAPAPETPAAKPEQKQQPSVIKQVAPIVQTKSEPVVTTRPLDEIVLADPGPIATEPKPVNDPPLPPVAEPVRTTARIDPRSTLQPAYPPSEQRAGNEGSVTVRLLVGADGRVKKVTRVSAASDAFYRATERQALTYWRFKPATLDGRPVESQTVMTVHFRLDA